MDAGVKLNILVAEHVMEWTTDGYEWRDKEGKWQGHCDWTGDYPFEPSTNIADAWRVVEKITEPPSTMEASRKKANTHFAQWFINSDLWACSASEAAHSICLNALRIMGNEEV